MTEYEKIMTVESEDGFPVRFFRNNKGGWAVGDMLYIHADNLSDQVYDALKFSVSFYKASRLSEIAKWLKKEDKRITPLYAPLSKAIMWDSPASRVWHMTECLDFRMSGLRPVNSGSVTKWVTV